MREIWAVLEATETALHEASGELLGELADLARQQPGPTKFCAVLLLAPGQEPPDVSLLPKLGVECLYLLEHTQLARYSNTGYVSAIAEFIRQREPLLVATGAVPNGRDWMPRLAARLHLPFVPNSLSLDLHDEGLFALRAIYGGRAYAQTRTALHGRTALATLVAGIRGAPTHVGSASLSSLEITRFASIIPEDHEQERVRQVAIQASSPEEVELEVAERIVAGGRGIGQAGFSTLASFAPLLGAAVGATRVATDLGWIEHARQIGATGKIVRPRLYIACGISGAAQHTSGMTESQTVVAINPDRSAPIFALADLGLLGDANQVLPLAARMLAHPEHTDPEASSSKAL